MPRAPVILTVPDTAVYRPGWEMRSDLTSGPQPLTGARCKVVPETAGGATGGPCRPARYRRLQANTKSYSGISFVGSEIAPFFGSPCRRGAGLAIRLVEAAGKCWPPEAREPRQVVA